MGKRSCGAEELRSCGTLMPVSPSLAACTFLPLPRGWPGSGDRLRFLPVEMNRKVWASRKTILGAVRKIVTSRVAAHKERLRRAAQGELPDGGAGGGAGGGEGTERVDLLNLMLNASDLDSDPMFAHGAPHGGSGVKGQGKGAGAGAGEATMSVQQLMDECLTFLGAGFETTANLMTWTMMLLSQHPEWQEKGRQEALALCQAGKWAPTFEQLSDLKILTCILNESLRLYPPGTGLGRSVTEDTRVTDSLVLPKGCDVFVPVQVPWCRYVEATVLYW